MNIYTLSAEEIDTMLACGKILSKAMQQVAINIKAGTASDYLDQVVEEFLISNRAKPAFKNYEVAPNEFYPFASCISINEEIVHGLPGRKRVLLEGDIVSIDIGATFKGISTDMARTFGVGNISPEAAGLIATTRESLDLAIEATKAGDKIGRIGEAVEAHAASRGYSVIRDLVGHGIGREIHMDPQIPNFKTKNKGPIIREGMALAIEPMISAGKADIKTEPDGWTIRTRDRSLSAHFEDTVVIRNGKTVVVTR